MNENQELNNQPKKDWKGAFILFIGILALIAFIKIGIPWLWGVLSK